MAENKYFCMVAKGEPASGEFLVRAEDEEQARESLRNYIGEWLGIAKATLHFVEMSPTALDMVNARGTHNVLEYASGPVTVTRMYEDNPMGQITHADGTIAT